MRVLWITSTYPPMKGGMGVSCKRLVSGLRRRGITVDCCVWGAASGPEMEAEERDNGMDLLVPRRGHEATAFHLLLSALSAGPDKPGYRLVVGFGANWPGFLAVSAAAWLGLPSVVMVRGNDLDRDWFDVKRSQWVREALSRAHAVITVSSEKKRVVEALFPGKRVFFLPNGIDPSWWEPLPADRQRSEELRRLAGGGGRLVLGVFGEMKEKKGLPVLVRALRRAGLLDRFGLLVVGKLDAEAQSLVASPSLLPHLHYVPFVPQEELSGYYRACDLVVIPSLYDGMPNVMLEAMASGVPVAASAVGGMADVVEEGLNGFLFRPGEWQDLADALGRASSLGREGLAELGQRARALVEERFSVEREIEGLKAVIQEVGRCM